MSRFNILIDTGFWIALYDPADDPKRAKDANRILADIESEILVLPYPTLYEFVNSRLSRRDSVAEFEKLLGKPNVLKLADDEYRDRALNDFFNKHKYTYTDLSLVDEVIKLILRDPNTHIDYLVTFDSALKNDAASIGIRAV